MVRSVIAVVFGFLTGGVVVGVLEAVGGILVPLPEGVDPFNITLGEIPATNYLVILFAWAWGAITAGAVAGMIASRALIAHGLIAGSVLMFGGIISLFTIPSPLWFWCTGLAVFPLGSWIGGATMARLRPAAETGATEAVSLSDNRGNNDESGSSA